MTRRSGVIPCLAAALLVLGAAAAPGADIVAQRGDLRVTATDLRDALSGLDPAARARVTANSRALAAFARERLLNLAVLAEAKAKGWDTRPDVVRRINETRDAMIVQTYLNSVVPPDPAYPGDADVATAYENNKARLTVPRQYHVAQIVLLAKQGATAREDDEVRRKALELRAQAVRSRADFGEIARKYSQETVSAEKGGDIGWLREPDIMPAVRDVVAAMPENGISQPVRVPDGWHILKLLGTILAGPLPLADAKPRIVEALRQARTQQMMRAYVDDMVKTQPIELNEIELTKQLGAAK